MAQGHPEARRYPLPVLWQETQIVRRRLNREIANEAIFTQMAIASILSEKAGKKFQARVKQLLED